ncbi:MAG TPA: hypothetical protein PLR71_01510 [Deltaproteobacteria bacterium]|nr:hypothetical protein [Deltaproteobacteria bacterium]HQI80209.1 hypothetical protein [Deltaproteobacteria bacterium]
MDLTCHACGFRAHYLEFAYLCRNGCPACGESDLRRCPKCGASCVFSRAEALEDEEVRMNELAYRLWSMKRTQDPGAVKEAKRIIATLSKMNLRWNIPGISELLLHKQKELFLEAGDL